MNVLIKFTSRRIAIACTVLFLSACGGGSGVSTSRDALPASEALQSLADNATAQALVVAPVPNPLNPADPNASTNDIAVASAIASGDLPPAAALNPPVILPGIADVYIGTLDVPYYFDTTNSTRSFWLPSLAVREVLNVPVMMTVPNANSGQAMPEAGWPIVIYQHGITRNRTDVIAYADAQAQAGFAVIAIDLPTHGLTDESNPFHASQTAFPTDTEQTFGVDLRTQVNGVTIAAEPDGVVDDSGTHFINIPSLLTSRDNVRQGSANLLTLRKSLGGIVNAATQSLVPVDTSRVGLIAHSLGGMVAIPYLGVETTPTPSSIVMSGATITKVLQDSVNFAPVIAQGLAAVGVVTPEAVAEFYANAQVIIDAGEPANYAAAAAANHPIHLIEVIGDETVPNSSTENLANIMGANSISTTTPGIAPGNTGIVRFTEGSHSSPLDPTASPAATVEIQTQLATFQATMGTIIKITDGNVIQ